MSADESTLPAAATFENSLRRARILRYAVGTSLAMGVALGIAWPLSYLTPVLVQSFLGPPAARPRLKAAAVFIAVIAVACLAGVWLCRLLLPYPLAFVLVIGLALFHIFYAKTRGAPVLLVTWLLISITVLPIVSAQSMQLSIIVSRGLIFGASAAFAFVWLAHALVPDPPAPPGFVPPEAPGPVADATTTAGERIAEAYTATAVVFPVVIYFNVFERTDAVLILVFVALLSMQSGFADDFKAGLALIAGNVMGGIVAILIYNLLVVVPLLWYMMLLTLLGGLLFGARLFSGARIAKLFGSAFSTTLLIVGSTTTSTGDAGGTVLTRVVQISVAVSYVVLAFGLLRRLRVPGAKSASR